MAAKIIDGKALASKMKETLKKTSQSVKSLYGVSPLLAVVAVGNNPASEVYIRQKERACREVGVSHNIIHLHADATQNMLDDTLDRLAQDPSISGILLQLPLPSHLNEQEAILHIPPHKDVDGFTAENVGKLWSGSGETIIPCTPAGIMYMLDEEKIDPSGKHVVIVGRSNIVGKPLAALMLRRDATVTLCHSKTENLSSFTRQADILVVAVGKPKLITADMVNPGAVVIDVGINRVDGKLCGDVDFDSVKEIASYITPVPGGVGAMTVADLIQNTIYAAAQQKGVHNTYDSHPHLLCKGVCERT